MKRCILLVFCVVTFGSIHADKQESTTTDTPIAQLESEQEHKEETVAQLEHSELEKNEAGTIQNIKHGFFGSFKQFIRIFLILLNNQKVQNSVKTIEEMLVALVQTALQAIKAAQANPKESNQDVAKKLLEADPALKRAMAKALTKNASFYNPLPSCKNHGPWCCQKPKQADKNAKIVLETFAQIASHFINILQNPNDTEEMAPHLMGMLGGIINIGTHVIKSGDFDRHTTTLEISEYVEHLDTDFKEEVASTIARTMQYSFYQDQ